MDAVLQGLDPLLDWVSHYGSLDRISGWFLYVVILIFGAGAAFRYERQRFRSRLQIWSGRIALGAGLYSLLSVPIKAVGLLAIALADRWPALMAAALVLTAIGLVLNMTNPLDRPRPKPETSKTQGDPRMHPAAADPQIDPGPASDDPDFPKLPPKPQPTRERAAAIEKRLDEQAAREAADKYTRE